MSNNTDEISKPNNYLKQLNKESFKSKYKFIDFKKSDSQLDSPIDLTKNENLKEFYQHLISESSSTTNKDNLIETTKKTTLNDNENEILKNPVNKLKLYTSNEYLKAAQNNDLNLIKAFLTDEPNKLNFKDDYKWNALMIAIASNNNEIVKYFVQKQTNNKFFAEFLNSKDSAGNTAHSLAVKFNNKTALKLLNESQLIETKKDKEKSPNKELKAYYCELCKLETIEPDLDHFKSMVHILNENETKSDKNKLTYNYHLRSSNKGYQLLCRSGWNEQSGLGKKEQGGRFPIKTKLKLDREGIGLDKNESKKQSTSTRGRLELSFKNLKEIKKKDKRMKRLERNLRFEFNN